MNKGRFLSTLFLWVSFMMLTDGLAFAERDCTHEVTRSDGTKYITIDCTASYTQTSLPTSETLSNQFLYNTLENNLFENVNQGLENFQERTAATSSGQGKLDQISSDSQEKEQAAIDAEQAKQEEQEDKLENSKHQ